MSTADRKLLKSWNKALELDWTMKKFKKYLKRVNAMKLKDHQKEQKNAEKDTV